MRSLCAIVPASILSAACLLTACHVSSRVLPPPRTCIKIRAAGRPQRRLARLAAGLSGVAVCRSRHQAQANSATLTVAQSQASLRSGRRKAQITGPALIRWKVVLTWLRAQGSNRLAAPLWRSGPIRRTDLYAAWLAALEWHQRHLRHSGHAELSDYLQFAFILWKGTCQPALRRFGKDLLHDLAIRYRQAHPIPDARAPIEEFFDAAAALYYLHQIRVPFPDLERQIAILSRDLEPSRLLRNSRAPWNATASSVLDALVDLYFLERLGLHIPIDYGTVRTQAVAWPYRTVTSLGARRFDDQTYLVTHTVYVLSDFATHAPVINLDRQRRYLRQWVDYYFRIRDVETLGEITDSLKILGSDYHDPLIRRLVLRLLESQTVDGSWGGTGYDQAHTAWTALNGLVEYRWSGHNQRRSHPGEESHDFSHHAHDGGSDRGR
ncbi:MAG: hypothetical protein J7M25_05155 [Deltaproteobacteria bacterium]|nr:hypothetical protein [Deltaproteobacteria bacterium]